MADAEALGSNGNAHESPYSSSRGSAVHAAADVLRSPFLSCRGDDAVSASLHGKEDDENALVVLKYNVAQSELREMVHALYASLETREQQGDASRKEVLLMREKHERWKREVLVEQEQSHRQVQQCQHDMARMNQQIQELQTLKDELEAEKSRMSAQMEEKDATIKQLSSLAAEQRRGNQRADASVMVDELEHMVDNFSRKEREVYSNMEHAEYRGCLEQDPFRTQSSPPKSMPDRIESDQVPRLEHEKANSALENRALVVRCKHFRDEIQELKDQIADLLQENEAQRKVISRYQQSADDGTQTIECLQDSLVRLCDQVASERVQHETARSKSAKAAREREHQLLLSVEDLHTKLAELQSNTEARNVSAMLQQAAAQRENDSVQDKSTEQREMPQIPRKSPAERRNTKPPDNNLAKTPAKAPAQTPTRMTESDNDIEDIEDDEVTSTPLKEAGKIPTAIHAEKKSPTALCRICGEEPFGFMVKCQKCKDPFHAGCVKPANGKRRISHVFKCSTCAVQRPTKVMRQETSSSPNPDAVSTVSIRPALP